MSDKEKIKEEIKRRLSNLWYLIPEGEKVLQDSFTKEDANNLGKYTALESILQFIDSIPEEHNQSPVIMYGLSCGVGLEDAVKERELYKEYQGDPERQEEFIDFAKFGNQYQEHNEDLEKEIDDYINKHFSECDDGVLISDENSTELTLLDVASIARYFFEFGLKAQKGE